METKTFILSDCSSGKGPYQIETKRYRFLDNKIVPGRRGVILFLVNGNGFNKETWEAFLDDLLELQRTAPDSHTYVKEAWAFDCANHGRSAVLNDKRIFTPSGATISVTLEDFARSGLNILESGIIERAKGDRLVLLGHSVGSAAAVWLASLYQERGHLLDALILAEPPGELFSKEPITKQNSEAFIPLTKNRKDIWPSKEEAFTWLSSKPPYKAWDKRVLRAYVDHGLCPLPTGGYPNRLEGVTLSCHREHEIFAYSDHPELNKVIAKFPSVQKAIPFHAIFGEKSFLRPKAAVREELARTPGITVDEIPNGDHLLVHEMPKELVQAVNRYLQKVTFRDEIMRSRF